MPLRNCFLSSLVENINKSISKSINSNREIQESIYNSLEEIDKMIAKRNAEVKILEAEAAGKAEIATTKAQEEIVKIKAQREADMKIIQAEARIKEAESKVKEAEANAKAMKINSKAQAEAQKLYNENLTKEFLQLKALESPNAKFIYYPTGTDKLPSVNINQNTYQYHYDEKAGNSAK